MNEKVAALKMRIESGNENAEFMRARNATADAHAR